MYSKDLVTSNVLSMNLGRCGLEASTHSAGKLMSTAAFCDCVPVDCSFGADYSPRGVSGVQICTYEIACSGIFSASYLAGMGCCFFLLSCVHACVSEEEKKKEKRWE